MRRVKNAASRSSSSESVSTRSASLALGEYHALAIEAPPASAPAIASVTPAPIAVPSIKPILDTFLEAPGTFVPGAPAAMRVLLTAAYGITDSRPIEGARVSISLQKDGKSIASVLDADTNA